MEAETAETQATGMLAPSFARCPYPHIAELHAGHARTNVEPRVGRVVHRYEDATQAGECPLL